MTELIAGTEPLPENVEFLVTEYYEEEADDAPQPYLGDVTLRFPDGSPIPFERLKLEAGNILSIAYQPRMYSIQVESEAQAEALTELLTFHSVRLNLPIRKIARKPKLKSIWVLVHEDSTLSIEW